MGRKADENRKESKFQKTHQIHRNTHIPSTFGHSLSDDWNGQVARMVQLKLERENSRWVASPACGAEMGLLLSVWSELFFRKDVGCNKLVEQFFMDMFTSS